MTKIGKVDRIPLIKY